MQKDHNKIATLHSLEVKHLGVVILSTNIEISGCLAKDIKPHKWRIWNKDYGIRVHLRIIIPPNIRIVSATDTVSVVNWKDGRRWLRFSIPNLKGKYNPDEADKGVCMTSYDISDDGNGKTSIHNTFLGIIGTDDCYEKDRS